MKTRNTLKFVLITLAILFLISLLLSSAVSLFLGTSSFGNIALIHIKGPITTGSASSFGDSVASSTRIIEYIEDAEKDDSIKAILFEINSPGGSAVASKEIVDAIKRTEKPTYSLIREVGASGAYWSASATDTIIANELSVTGSIGVISSYVEFAGLMERYNLTYRRLVSGKYKDMGSPLKELEEDEKDLLLEKIDRIHDYFVRSVAENRNMSVSEIEPLATGEFFLGSEAKENNLVDVLGDKNTAKELIREDHNLTEVKFAEYSSPASLLSLISGVFSENSYEMGRGIGSELKKTSNINKVRITT